MLNKINPIFLQPGMYLNITGYGNLRAYIFVHNANEVRTKDTQSFGERQMEMIGLALLDVHSELGQYLWKQLHSP